MSLEAVLIGGFEVQVTLGIMIVAFMRASLLPSHWLRAFTVASLTVLVLPLTVLVISIWMLSGIEVLTPEARGLRRTAEFG